MIFTGKPTAKMLSCGTTRETTPKATSVRISASSTGAATSSAAAKIPAKAAAAAGDQLSRATGTVSIGTSS